MLYRHVIWDWNGTLLDDAWVCVEIINDLLARRGLPIVTAESYQRLFDFPVQDYYRAVGFDFDREPFAVLAEEFTRIYDIRRFECALQPGSALMLEGLAADGVTHSVLSAYEQRRLDELVGHYALTGHFQHMVGLSDYLCASKVDNGRRLMAELGHAASEMVMIGDTTHDAEVARAMGIDCILITCGHQSRERLLAYGVPVCASLAECRGLLCGEVAV